MKKTRISRTNPNDPSHHLRQKKAKFIAPHEKQNPRFEEEPDHSSRIPLQRENVATCKLMNLT
jgi:hypothetical protein